MARAALPGRLVEVFGPERVSTSLDDLDASSGDCWPRRLIEGELTDERGARAPERPLAVVWPEHVEEVCRLVELARTEEFQLAPLGAGSGVCGGFWPDPNTVVVDTKRLRDFEVSEDGTEVFAGAGLLGVELEERLAQRGKTVGHFPSSIQCSTVGGWVATRGAGQCSGRYGKVEDMVTGLEAVLGTGRALRARARARESLLPLLVGSEGTLGIITRAAFRLHPAPALRAYAAFAFPTFEAGQLALREIYQRGLRPAVARLYDPVDSLLHASHSESDDALRELVARTAGAEATLGTRSSQGHAPSRVRRGVEALLLRGVLKAPAQLANLVELLERRGRADSVLLLVLENLPDLQQASEAVAQVCLELGARSLGEGPARQWFLRRYDVSFRQSRVFRAGAFNDTMEVSAPWSKLDGVYRAVKSAIGGRVLLMAHVSHSYPSGAGIYFTFVGREGSPARALSLYDAVWRDALSAAVEAGASVSHHHGVGRSKASALADQGGGAGRHLLTRAWDPSRLLNPGVLEASDASWRGKTSVAERFDRARFVVDHDSGLAELDARLSLDEVWNLSWKTGLELPLAPHVDGTLSLAEWLAQGMPGAPSPWTDPVGRLLVGFEGRLRNGDTCFARPVPRRAEGPDMAGLFVGMLGHFGTIERATLELTRRGVRAAVSSARTPPERPLEAAERAALDELARALGVVTPGP